MERGRPRQFDEQQALESAMNVFWREGFRGASMAELTAAMNMNKPSLYAAFGDKEQLYLRALAHYGATRAGEQAAALNGDLPVSDAIATFLKLSVKRACDKSQPGGCYVVNALADCGTGATPDTVADATTNAFRYGLVALEERLKRAKKTGELPGSADTGALAHLFAAVMAGMATMSRAGASKAALYRVVDQAMSALPQADTR